MMEPRPLLAEGATEVETALLRAGRADGPRKEVAVRAFATIHGLLPAAPLEAGFAAAAAEHTALVRWAKIVAVAVGLGGAATVAYHFAPSHPVAPSSPPPSLPATVPAAASVQAPPTPDIGEGFAAPRGEEPVRTRRKGLSGRARNEGAVLADNSLGQETMLLDRAREELDAQRGPEALQRLDLYDRRFPRGRLQPEAMILRLAALFQTGRIDAAESLAGRLLADEAYKAYAPRIRSLSREAKR